ncbi:hypothetical protein, partial [Prevotella sp.]|uniref:hypothetical protein n=1 Tax=Prevotella sp. TaxID=59823 RepID=UPI003080FC6D
SPTGEVRWGLMSIVCVSCSYSATDVSPLSFSPEGEMQVTLVCGKAIEYQTTESNCPSPTIIFAKKIRETRSL